MIIFAIRIKMETNEGTHRTKPVSSAATLYNAINTNPAQDKTRIGPNTGFNITNPPWYNNGSRGIVRPVGRPSLTGAYCLGPSFVRLF